jgi:nucleoid DNA-binding protein
MSNEKLNTQDLVTDVASKTSETKKEIDIFLKEFIVLIQEILLKEKIIKVKGLGTFKLSWNESRKSVNVQTGQEFEIAGHHKVVFIPENELKDLVNEPFSHLETVMLDDSQSAVVPEKEEPKINPLKNFSIQAQEIASIISELKSQPSKEEVVEIIKVAEPVVEEKKEPIVIEEKKEEVLYLSDENKELIPEIKLQEIEPEPVVENQPKKKSSFILWFFIILILLVAGFGIYCFFSPVNLGSFDFTTKKVEPKRPTTNVVVPQKPISTQPAVAPPVTEQVATKPAPQKAVEEVATKPKEVSKVEININDYEMQEVVADAGNRLASFSTKYYGSYLFWPYVYLANKDNLPNPNKITKGQKIKVPKLPKEMVDANNPNAVAKAKYIEQHLKEY